MELLEEYSKRLKDAKERPKSRNETERERLEETYGKLLDEFIQQEREKMQMGSGDDLFYELQVEGYINKQRGLWETFIEFIRKKKSKKGVDVKED